jgi:hypothetical protein
MNSRHLGLLLGLMALLVACPDETKPPAVNKSPVAVFDSNASVLAGTALAFDASSSSDPDNDALGFSWDFGDGGKGGVPKIAHVFAAAGDFDVMLMVTDGKGGTSRLEKTIAVSPAPVPSKTVTVQGWVRGIDNLPLSGVNVGVIGGAGSSVTGADGKVSLTLGVGMNVTLKLEKTGYTDQIKIVNLPNNVGTDGYFEANLMPRETAQTLINAAGNLTGKDGVKLSIPDGGLVDSSGKTLTGAVQVGMTPVDVTGAALPAFPGEFEGINPNGSSTPIVSYGTTEFVLTQNGQRVQVAPGKKARLELPMYTSTNLDGSSLKAGDKIGLWSLDEGSGIWINEGEGTVVTNPTSPTGFALNAEVGHFSWWNADMGFIPWIPKPKCINDVPGQYDNIFAQAQICNMLAENDRALSGSAAPIRQTVQRVPLIRATRSIPMAGGVGLPIPSGVPIILRASILNGSWQGVVTVNELAGVSKEVLIPLRPVASGGNDETITPPFDQTRGLQTGQTARFKFDASAFQWAQITVGQAGSTLEGKVRLLSGSTELKTASFNSNNATFTQKMPNSGQFVLEITGTANTPGAYSLGVKLLGTIREDTIALPFTESKTTLPLTVTRHKFSVNKRTGLRVIAGQTAGAGGNLRVVNSGGSEIGKLEIGFGSKDLSVVLPSAGDYAIEVAESNTNGLAYTLQASLSSWASIAPTVGADASIYLILKYKAMLDHQGRINLASLAVRRSDQKAFIGMRRFDGTNWNSVVTDLVVGDPGYYDLCADFGLDANDNLVAIYSSLDKNSFDVQRWKPGGWQTVGANAGKLPKSGQYGNNCLAPPILETGADDQPMVAYAIDGLPYVQRYDGTTWVGLGPNDGNIVVSSQGQILAMVMKLDGAGNPVVVWRDYFTSGSYGLRYKTSPAAAWVAVGPNLGLLPIPSDIAGFSPTSLTLDVAGNPVAAGNTSICSTTSGCGVTSTGVGLYRFNGNVWQPSGGHTALAGNNVVRGYGAVSLLLNADLPILAWHEGGSNSAVDTYVQSWGGSSIWAGLGSPSGALGTPQPFSDPQLFKDASGNILMSLKGQVSTNSSSYATLELYGYIP